MLTSHAEIGIMIIFSFVGGHLEENETVVFGFLELRFIFLCPRNWRWRGGGCHIGFGLSVCPFGCKILKPWQCLVEWMVVGLLYFTWYSL